MSVIPLTIFFSLLLAGLFVVLFAREQRRSRYTSAEHDSLLPLADETPRTAVRRGHAEIPAVPPEPARASGERARPPQG